MSSYCSTLASSTYDDQRRKLVDECLRSNFFHSIFTLKTFLFPSHFGAVLLATFTGSSSPQLQKGTDVVVKLSCKSLFNHGGLYNSINNSNGNVNNNNSIEDVRRETSLMLHLAAHRINDRSHNPLNGDKDSDFIVRLLSVYENDAYHIQVFEHCEQRDLLQLTQHYGALNEDLARVAFKQMCCGVNFLHAHGVAHIDLSLENVCLHNDGKIRIIDFGLAAIHPNAPAPPTLNSPSSTGVAGATETEPSTPNSIYRPDLHNIIDFPISDNHPPPPHSFRQCVSPHHTSPHPNRPKQEKQCIIKANEEDNGENYFIDEGEWQPSRLFPCAFTGLRPGKLGFMSPELYNSHLHQKRNLLNQTANRKPSSSHSTAQTLSSKLVDHHGFSSSSLCSKMSPSSSLHDISKAIDEDETDTHYSNETDINLISPHSSKPSSPNLSKRHSTPLIQYNPNHQLESNDLDSTAILAADSSSSNANSSVSANPRESSSSSSNSNFHRSSSSPAISKAPQLRTSLAHTHYNPIGPHRPNLNQTKNPSNSSFRSFASTLSLPTLTLASSPLVNPSSSLLSDGSNPNSKSECLSSSGSGYDLDPEEKDKLHCLAGTPSIAQPSPLLSNSSINHQSPSLFSPSYWDAYANDVFSLGVMLYSLLCCRRPFLYASYDDPQFMRMMNGEWMHDKYRKDPNLGYSHLSDDAILLINSIIKPQHVRPDIQTVLKDPWLNTPSLLPNKNNSTQSHLSSSTNIGPTPSATSPTRS